ncbi:alpha-(1,3)-fucosyltransferase C-like [Palaemon carinicauda]|uniref:alpha-(1,3)-fucosyltransferase C-like n=1 Tax=Palaemon carinicauda TaxID=392227 RepID=UPI0035B5B789
MELFRKKARGELIPKIKSFRSGSVPRLMVWAEPFRKAYWDANFVHITGGLCPLPCKVEYDRRKINTTDAILIAVRETKDRETVTKSLSPRDPNQPWIGLAFNPPNMANAIFKTKFRHYNQLFNRTMTYRRDADIVFLHGFIASKEDAKLLPRTWVIPPKMKIKNDSRKLAVAFISNCNAMSKRLLYSQKFQKYAPLDIYGRCGNLKCGGSMYVIHRYNATEDQCLQIAGEGYLFYFAFENNFCKDYISEKAYNLLHYSIVPVVRGSANYSSVLPPNSYIDANNYSPKELADRLLYLQAHPQEYRKYLGWKKYFQPSTVGGAMVLCHLCTRLYDPDFYEYKLYEDFDDWFVEKSHCLAGLDF